MNYSQAFDDLMVLECGTPQGSHPFGLTLSLFDGWLAGKGLPSSLSGTPTRLQALDFAYEEYWVPAGCGHLPDGLDFVVFQAAYNCGTATAVEWLQQSVGATVDGVFGPETLKSVIRHQTELTITSFLHHQQDYYDRLENRIPRDRKYANGWHNRILKTMRLIGFAVPPEPVTVPSQGTVNQVPAVPESLISAVSSAVIEPTLSLGGKMNPTTLFFTKLGTGIIASGVWIWLVYTGHDTTTQEAEIVRACEGWVIGLVSHLMTKKVA